MLSIYKSLVAEFGSQDKTAAALGIDQSTVSGWVRGLHGMSARTALKAEAKTGGKFKAKDLCQDLNFSAEDPAA